MYVKNVILPDNNTLTHLKRIKTQNIIKMCLSNQKII